MNDKRKPARPQALTTTEGRAEWRRLMSHLESLQIDAHEGDRGVYLRHCLAWQRFCQLEDQRAQALALCGDGTLWLLDKGVKEAVEYVDRQLARVTVELQRTQLALGMAPSARAKPRDNNKMGKAAQAGQEMTPDDLALDALRKRRVKRGALGVVDGGRN